jgi:hypothetical protein
LSIFLWTRVHITFVDFQLLSSRVINALLRNHIFEPNLNAYPSLL